METFNLIIDILATISFCYHLFLFMVTDETNHVIWMLLMYLIIVF